MDLSTRWRALLSWARLMAGVEEGGLYPAGGAMVRSCHFLRTHLVQRGLRHKDAKDLACRSEHLRDRASDAEASSGMGIQAISRSKPTKAYNAFRRLSVAGKLFPNISSPWMERWAQTASVG
jgi:hypothetical protein